MFLTLSRLFSLRLPLKSPTPILSVAHDKVHNILYPHSSYALVPEGRTGTACEPSKEENVSLDFNVVSVTIHTDSHLSLSLSLQASEG
jgi:hypothetical protein